jgi:hypothetical protein
VPIAASFISRLTLSTMLDLSLQRPEGLSWEVTLSGKKWILNPHRTVPLAMIKDSRITRFFIIFILLNLVFGCSVSPTVEREIPKRSITLAWDSPRANAEGTALNNLAGYRIYYGLSSGVYPNKIDIADPSATEHTLYKLSPGTYYFVVTSYSDSGMESEHSKEVTITIK